MSRAEKLWAYDAGVDAMADHAQRTLEQVRDQILSEDAPYFPEEVGKLLERVAVRIAQKGAEQVHATNPFSLTEMTENEVKQLAKRTMRKTPDISGSNA